MELTKMKLRDTIITGSFFIGENGLKEPVNGWEEYANKLEDYVIKTLNQTNLWKH